VPSQQIRITLDAELIPVLHPPPQFLKTALVGKESINHSLCDRLSELGIKALELDEKNNEVIIYLSDLEDVQKIENIKKIEDSPAIEYQKMEGEFVFTAADVINEGVSIVLC
jgi:hypothetical protein